MTWQIRGGFELQ